METIPKSKWTWRGFYFYARFLFESQKWSKKESGYEDRCSTLISDYKTFFPDDERAYMFEFSNSYAESPYASAESIKILEDVVAGKTPVKRVPHISYKLAVIYFDEKRYEESLSMVKRCLIDSLSEMQQIDRSSLYIISTFCKLSLIYKRIENQQIQLPVRSNEEDLILINEIYADFASAKSNNERRYKRLLPMMRVLKLLTGVENEYDIEVNDV